MTRHLRDRIGDSRYGVGDDGGAADVRIAQHENSLPRCCASVLFGQTPACALAVLKIATSYIVDANAKEKPLVCR